MRVQAAETTCVLDVDGCLARFGGDKELFAELTAMLLEDAPPLYVQLKSAVDAQDALRVEARAHALKGLLANCGGMRAASVAQQLEDAGRSQNFAKTGSQIEKLDAELDALVAAIHDYRGQSAK
jgi:HPt (histidine-containing phosphotransfer) domain-containing protein